MTRAETDRKAAEKELISQIEELAQLARNKLASSLKAKGLVLTGALKDSLYAEGKSVQQDLVYALELGFQGYGTLKDLKFMKPGVDIDSLVQYVRTVGLDKFKYVPGYLSDAKRRKPISTNRAELRIAWGLAMGRKNKGQKYIRRKGKGWYNPIKGRLEYDFFKLVSDRMAELGHNFVKTSFESRE